MTREEKTICKIYLDDMDKHHTCNEYKLLMQLLEQEPCDDCISRKAVLNTLDDMDNVLDEDRTVETYKMLLTECVNVLPPVTPAENVGRWIDCSNGWMCSACSKDYTHDSKYCPNCGAKMEVEE